MTDVFIVAFLFGALFVTFRTGVIDYLLKGSKFMGLVEDIKATIEMVAGSVVAVDAKLDEVLVLIESLKAGGGASVEQLEEIQLLLTGLKEHAAAVEAEAAALVEPPQE